PIEKELRLYLWSDYLADDTIPNFEREFGVRVTVDTYESNEEMAAKLLAGATGYDLVLPSSYLFPVLFSADLLAPLRRELLTNWGNVAPMFLDPAWDPGNRHSVPWGWGTTGLAYRRDLVTAPPDSWEVFFDERYRGKMTMLDDLRDVIGSFLKLRGHSLNSVDPAALAEARADAIRAKANLKAYVSAPVKAQLVAGDVWIAQLWSGDAMQAMAEQPAIAFAIPKEGSMIFSDALVVPRSAPHPRAAHEFMNYILRPEVGAAIADKTGYGTPNQAALPLTQSKIPYPTAEELTRLEYQKDLAENSALWDRIWTEIKAG
ncbi:MAG: spermidine/putrescine ABC transporter substrate-binding protein, partial [Gemmatimonadales bacterium]|nr:spermidine/putrescine ABC transporter substrate-binding protein [Gemmatimonadales bacterium]